MSKLAKFILIMACILNLSHISNIFAQGENLSPIESIDWGLQTKEETNSEKVEPEISSKELIEETSKEELNPLITTEASGQNTLPKVTNPLELLEIINTEGVQTSSNYNLIHFINGGVQMAMKAYVNQGDYGYLTYQEPPYMPRTLLVKANNGQIEDSFMSVESLVTYATDAINNYPDIYESSPIMDLYVFAQENNQDFLNKYIQLDPDFDGAKEMYQEVNKLDAYFLNLLTDFLQDKQSQLESGPDPNVAVLNLEGDLAEQFTQQLQDLQADYPELDRLLSNFEQGVQGTISFNYASYEVGIGLLSPAADGQTNGLEYYIRPVQLNVEIPDPESLLSEQEFVDLIGFDALSDFQEFESNVELESFNLEGE